MAITEGTCPAPATAQGSSGTRTVTTAAFSPPGQSLLVAIVTVDYGGSAPSVTVSDSGTHSWTQQVQKSGTSNTWAAIYTCPLTSAPGSITVTAADATSHGSSLMLDVRVVTGVAASQAGAATGTANGTGTSVTGSITTTTAGSWAYIAALINWTETTVTPNGSTTTIYNWQDTGGTTTGLAGRQSSPTGTPGATTLGWTVSGSSVWAWAALEVLPASDVPPATVVQAKQVTGSHTVTLDTATTAHNTLYLAYAGSSAGSGDPSVTGVTLGGSADHWASQVTQHQGTQSYSVSAIWQDADCAGGQTAVAVSGTNLVAADALVYVVEVSGMGTVPSLDKSSVGPLGTGSQAWTSNASGTTTAGGGFVLGVTAHGPYSSSDSLTGPGSPWTNCAQFQWSGGAAIAGYQTPASTGSYTYSGSSTGFDYYTSAVAAFKPDTSSVVITAGYASATGSADNATPTAGTGSQPDQGEGTGEAWDAFFSTTSSVQAVALSADGGGQAASAAFTVVSTSRSPLPADGTGAAYGATPLAGSVPVMAQAATGTGEAVPVLSFSYSPPFYLGIAAGGGRPQSAPGGSQVSLAPPGGDQWVFLGTIGHVQDLKYSFVMPGGADKMTCILKLHASLRSGILTPGFQVRIHRGGHVVWDGRLDEPAPGEDGWTVTAAGSGQRGNDFTAQYTGTWPAGQPDQFVNAAITRGLNWINPGTGQPSWLYTGQAPDSGSQTVAALLTQMCSRGGGTWYADSQPGGRYGGPDLKLIPVPSEVNRLLMVTNPVARTLGSATNQLVIRYQITEDNPSDTASGGNAAGATATYGVTTVANTAEAAVHGVTEEFVDLSSAGVMTAGDAQQIGNSILLLYQRASYAGPFTASPGQLTTVTGVPVDPGCDQAGTVCKLIISDFGYGGEVTPATPVVFPVGGYEWDDWKQVATITPFQTIQGNLSGLISLAGSD